MKISVEQWVREHGQVAHSSHLRDAGFSEHTMRDAVRTGRLVRVNRSWLVSPGCPPERVAAASVGGRVTCVSAARLEGLWSPNKESDAVHVAVPHSASRIPHAVTAHRATGPVPVAPKASTEPILNVLFHVARCLAPIDALAIWESALRLRRTTVEELRRTQWRSAPAQRFAGVAGALSDSGLESHFVMLMRLIGIDVRQQVWLDGHPVDALIGDRIVVQLDGFAHHRADDRRLDIAADARLVLLGYTVFRFDYHQLLFQPELVQQTILRAVAQGLHRAPRSPR